MRFCNLVKQAAALAVMVGSLWGNMVRAEAGPTIIERGTGPAMVFIPGLNSGWETFNETCAAFEQKYHCMLLQLPGFAGLPPTQTENYLVSTRDAVIHALQERHAERVILVGHSLGGVLGMMIAIEAPQLVGKLVLVDALPFAPANQNPALTAEKARPGAERMLQQRNAMNDEQYQAMALQNVGLMTRSAERQAQLKQWVLASDRATTTAALVDMMTTDLREAMGELHQPTLVLGAWAAYKQYGATLDSTRAIYTGQFAKAPAVEVRMSETGYHFLTWEDAAWLNAQIGDFLASPAANNPVITTTTNATTKVAGN